MVFIVATLYITIESEFNFLILRTSHMLGLFLVVLDKTTYK